MSSLGAANAYSQYGSTPAAGPLQQPFGADMPYEVAVPRKVSASRQYGQSHFLALVAGLMVPWLIFAGVYAVEASSVHYSSSAVVQLVALLAALLVLAAAGIGTRAWWRRDEGQDPSWYLFVALTGALALAAGIYLGDYIYDTYTEPYEDNQNLNMYTNVDVSTTVGAQMMDAGQVFFADNAVLDLDYSMGFQNVDTYCVAPITTLSQSKQVLTYDFWAIGLNCCSGHAPDFHCGEYSNPKAKAGLRLMTDSQRSYYRLAVQQAEAAYDIHASHPIFFEWMEDPTGEINAYETAATKYLLIGVLAYLAFQMVLVAVAVVVLSRGKGR
jgi:hypothetical protein